MEQLARWTVTDRWQVAGLDAGTSLPPYDRLNLGGHVGDVSNQVLANRTAVREAVGADELVLMRQVHGNRVHVVGAVGPDAPGDADGLVTDRPGVALVVLVADCVPVLLADDAAGVVGVAHAGREGVRLAVVDRTLEAMRSLGADETRIRVHLGPAVCGACYEVPADLRDVVEAAVPGTATTSRRGTPALDLRAGLAAHLKDRVRAVTVDPACTVEDDRYYSYRRDGVTGRFAGLAWLPS